MNKYIHGTIFFHLDFIGAFTWYKKIESKGKSTLQRHKEVTVLPPEQYKARFRDAMEQYFLAVPGINKIQM